MEDSRGPSPGRTSPDWLLDERAIDEHKNGCLLMHFFKAQVHVVLEAVPLHLMSISCSIEDRTVLCYVHHVR